MTDPRLKELSKILVDYSVSIKPQDNVLIVLYGLEGMPLLRQVYKDAVAQNAHVRYEIIDETMNRAFFDLAHNEQIEYMSEHRLNEAENTDVMIQIVAYENKMELATIDQNKLILKRKANKPLSDALHKNRWVLLEYPTKASAQDAGMSLEEWENFIFDSCILDWHKVSQEQEVLKNIMEATDKIHIIGDGTNLHLSIKGQKAVKCDGHYNMPDGEVFTSPIKDSVNGVITFNTPTVYMGKEFNWIKLTFKDGKAVSAESDKNQDDLNAILDTDAGARYVGEFSFGTNSAIQKPVKSILFDEKIGGSNHMALGRCYEEAPNGNDSSIHWDMIMRHTVARGKVSMDGKLVQEDGVWVDERLKMYN